MVLSLQKRRDTHQMMTLVALIGATISLSVQDTRAEPLPSRQARPQVASKEATPQEATPQGKRADQAYPARSSALSATFKRLNGHMHRSIREAIAHHRQHLGPLIIFEEGKMKLIRDDREVAAFSVSPPTVYHQLKVLGHVFFASMIQLQREELSHTELKSWIESFAPDVKTALNELDEMPISQALRSSQRVLITETLKLLDRAVNARLTREELSRFAEEMRAHVWENASRCAQVHLALIHEQAMKLMRLLTPRERETIRAHLYGNRGARRDSLTIQYLSWLFGENTGRESGRIVFSENIYTHDKAMDKLARYGMERHLATLIFDDPERLDRDLLGDVARAHLKTFPSVEEALKQSDIKEP